MSVTIKDVAREAGVATSTVSRTIKDHPSISEDTKRRVRKAMDRLGYVPNAAAQSLASKTTRNIAVILPPFDDEDKINNPFFMEMLNVIGKVCNEHQYITSIVSGNNISELLAGVKIMFQHKRVDGFILLYSLQNDPVIEYLHQGGIPYVLVGTPYAYENEVIYVDNDNFVSGKTATQFLLQNGHRKIAFVGFKSNERVHQERYEGYYMEMKNQNLDPAPYFKTTDVDDYLAFVEYLHNEKPTAVIACDDQFALGLVEVLRQQKLYVGDNISLISFNNSVFSTLVHPYLTTVDIHTAQLGEEATLALLDLLVKPKKTKTKLLIPHQVIKRETVVDLNQM